MLIYREKNLEVAKKEAKAKEKKNEEKQAASKDDVEIDHEERMQEVCFNVVDLSFCDVLSLEFRSKKTSMLPSRLPNNEIYEIFAAEGNKNRLAAFTKRNMTKRPRSFL